MKHVVVDYFLEQAKSQIKGILDPWKDEAFNTLD